MDTWSGWIGSLTPGGIDATRMMRQWTRGLAGSVRDFLPKAVRQGMLRAGRFLGAGMERPGFPSVESALDSLRRRGYRPRTCVDVGAYHGDWARMFRGFFPETRMLLVEAQEGLRGLLEARRRELGEGTDLEIAVLGGRDGDRVAFHEMESGSSVFAETSAVRRTVVERTTRRLDSVLAEHPGHRPVDFLKLDVQGYELKVLEGGMETLAGASVVLMEASLIPINEGCPLLAEVVGFMGARGFRVADFCSQIRRKDGVLWQTDLLFLREGSGVLPEPRLTPENWDGI